MYLKKLLNNPGELQVSWNSFFKMIKHEAVIFCSFRRIWLLSEQYKKWNNKSLLMFKEYSIPWWKGQALREREAWVRCELWRWMSKR